MWEVKIHWAYRMMRERRNAERILTENPLRRSEYNTKLDMGVQVTLTASK
jgi:hypothetical protein